MRQWSLSLFMASVVVVLSSAAYVLAQTDTQSSTAKPTIYVKILGKSQSGSYAKITVEITNASSRFLNFVDIDMAFFDKNGNHVGHDGALKQNVRPRHSYIGEVLLPDVDVRSVRKCKLGTAQICTDSKSGVRTDVTEDFDIRWKSELANAGR